MPGFFDIDDEYYELDQFNIHSSYPDPKWDTEEAWYAIPLDIDYTITNQHLWLVTLANYTFITKDFGMSTDTFKSKLDEFVERVPDLIDYRNLLFDLYLFLDKANNTRWLSVFTLHIKQNIFLAKVLMDGYKCILKEAQTVRKNIIEQLEKSFFPEYYHLKHSNFSGYLDLFTEWYLVKYNKNYPEFEHKERIDLENEKWTFIDKHIADHAHYRLARALATIPEDLAIVYLYSFLAVQPKISVDLFTAKRKSLIVPSSEKSFLPIALPTVSESSKVDAKSCDHEFMDIGDQTICIKCEATVRGNEEYGLHYP